jgi:hypothetical protein
MYLKIINQQNALIFEFVFWVHLGSVLPKESEHDVDENVSAAACHEEYSERRD